MNPAMVAELQVFSGRANPRWTLRPPDPDRLEQRVARLSEPSVPRASPRLGYNGVVVHVRDAWGSWRPWFHVGSGTATVVHGPRAGVYRDTVGLETWLLSNAQRAGLGDLLNQLFPPQEGRDEPEP